LFHLYLLVNTPLQPLSVPFNVIQILEFLHIALEFVAHTTGFILSNLYVHVHVSTFHALSLAHKYRVCALVDDFIIVAPFEYVVQPLVHDPFNEFDQLHLA
jgi:hypothetical protein